MNAQEKDEDFGPATPSWAESALQSAVDHIAFLLETAAEGHQPAWRLSHALLGIANRRGVLSEAQRDKLARAIGIFDAVAERVLPTDIDRGRIETGLAAALVQVCYWSMAPEERKGVAQAKFCDMEDYARLLRNAAHDSCLMSGIRQRDANRRREAAIAEFPFAPASDTTH
ncbi:hypothetical protein [Methylocystis parvus]|uniref:hypothetical protein n=1 Tax=Methylocystis parvus TaxID=134 RepID=UPI003C75C961